VEVRSRGSNGFSRLIVPSFTKRSFSFLIFSNSTLAGSSPGSWCTNRPCTASCKIVCRSTATFSVQSRIRSNASHTCAHSRPNSSRWVAFCNPVRLAVPSLRPPSRSCCCRASSSSQRAMRRSTLTTMRCCSARGGIGIRVSFISLM